MLAPVYGAREGVPARQSLSLFASRKLLGRAVPATVVYLGLTSLFTDVSAEMVSAILPLYAITFLQLTPLEFGFLDGIYQGAAGIVRLAGGIAADRWRRHKDIAVGGYAISALAKIGLLLAGSSLLPFGGALLADRSGKAIRTAPRDALISLSTPSPDLASAFAVHRALDTLGALGGPIVAFAVLSLAPGRFDAIFVASFCIALIGLGIIVLFVENRPADPAPRTRFLGRDGASAILRRPGYLTLVAVAAGLAVCSASDGFLYLALQRRLGFSPGIFPLLYVVTSLFYFVLAVPAGRLADRVGRGKVFVGGYALLPVVYLALLLPSFGYAIGIGALLLLGGFYAMTDGVLAAIASSLLAPATRGTGLAVLSTAVATAHLIASVLFGALWTLGGIELAISAFATAMAAGVALATLALRGVEVRPELA